MAASSLLSHSCSSLRLPDMLTVTHQYSTACVMFGNWATVERRRPGGQSESEKRAEGFPAHVVRILTALLVRRSCILGLLHDIARYGKNRFPSGILLLNIVNCVLHRETALPIGTR